ncbi:hypothetical protein [Shewanella sp. UCD-KL12]|uniref:hypothetical protein n=1 Tax=Shewanella sp. UCD-KL12 TaxID=1917163 RepID=UPI000971297C|nr:hypothetical protein [Shewanella sp. UCD-KL12]
MNKTILVKAYFKDTNETQKKPAIKPDVWGSSDAHPKTPKNDKTEVQKPESCVDSERLERDLGLALVSLNGSGYEVHSIVPVISGAYSYQFRDDEITSSPRLMGDTEAVAGGVSYGYGYGYSYTDSLIVIARKMTS